MSTRRLPTIDEVGEIEVDVVSHCFETERRLRIRLIDPTSYPRYRPFDLVFDDTISFVASDDLSGVYFRSRGRSAEDDGQIFELEVRELVPTEGRAIHVALFGIGDTRILFGKTSHEVKARIVAGRVTVEDAL